MKSVSEAEYISASLLFADALGAALPHEALSRYDSEPMENEVI